MFSIAIVLVLSVLLIVFLIRKNQMDKKSLTRKLNDDYNKPEEHNDDHI